MAAPTAAFTVIPLSDVDPDSPVSSSLMDSLRLNDQNLFAQLVGDPVTSPTFVAAAEHDHDGVNSKLTASTGGASLKLIERKEITADVDSFDFAATLDGDTEKVYWFVGRILMNTNRQITLRANGDLGLEVVPSDGGNNFAVFGMNIFALRTVQTVSVNLGFAGYRFAAGTGAASFGGQQGLAANLTSLGLESSTAFTDILKGSEFALYEVRQS